MLPVTALNLPPMPQDSPLAITEFRAWSGQFLRAAPDARMAMIEVGQAYAKEHTKQIAKMIKTDPQAAIAHAVPMVVRQNLPAEIVTLLEERPRLRGDYEVYGNVPAPGQEATIEPYTRTVSSSDGRRWNAYVYGRRQMQRSTVNVSLNGIAVGRDMAVSDSPVRVLEVGEVPETAGRQVVDVCPISGIETPVEKATASAPPPAVTEETPAFETPERVIYVCSGGHISQLEEQYITEEERAHWASQGVDLNSGTGSGPAHGVVGNIPSSWTTGNRTFLYIRAAFPDNPVDPQNEQECYNSLKDVNDFVVKNSYGRCYLTYAVAPLVILPYPLAWYTDVAGGDNVLQNHARQIARSQGYDYLSYNMDAVRWTGGPGSYGGSASVGNRGMRLKTNDSGTFMHELGHNLGVWHANFWQTNPPSLTGPGNNLEYGNTFDVMGSGGIEGQFTASFKNELSWMPQEQFWNVTSSGLYRISLTDDGVANPNLRYALRVRGDSERNYWAEFQLGTTNTGFNNGLMMTFDQWGLGGIGGSGGAPLNGSNRGAQLLDMTPGSFNSTMFDTRDDSALWVGRTFSDPDLGIHITPVAKNTGTTPPSMDVQVQVGNAPGNTAPTLALQASTLSTTAGNNVILTATASDLDGDSLSYAWVFGDGSYSTNNNAVQTKSWSTSGHYRVLCTASDMKGLRTTRSVLVTVGSPSTFTVSGNITGTTGQPLEGVYVANYAPSNTVYHNSYSSFRGTWTDSDGNYVITGLTAGGYTITPNLYPFVFSPSGFTNPVTVGPSTTGKNFTSVSLPEVTITYPDNTANEASSPGTAIIRLNRTGPLGSALSVQIYNTNTGSATRNIDYTLTPAPAAASSPDGGSGTSQYILPAGVASLDITLTPINDNTAEGIEYASLDFVNTAAGYLMAGRPRAVISITDDESSLPVVRITPVDDVGHEAGTDTLTLLLERNGANGAALNVNLTYTGTATNVTDYTAPATVTIPAGKDSATFTITPVNDTLIESTEVIIATITTPNANYLRDSTAPSANVLLNDDDMPVVNVAATDANAAEASSDKGVFTITRTGEIGSSLTVDYSINGRAILGTDYRRLDGRAVIPAGSSSITVEIVPFDDTLDEGAQDVILQLRTALNYVIGSNSTATVNIADNDASQIWVEMNTGNGVEPSAGSTNGPVFQINRPASGTAITVNYSISGTATSGTDFTALPGTITLGAAQSSRTVPVAMLADALMENAETVTLTLLPGTGYTLLPGQRDSATGYIYDGDQEMVDVNGGDVANSQAIPIAENGSSAYFLISRPVTAANQLVVSYTVSGTATSGSDFTALSGTATIPAGQSSVRVTVSPVNDSTPEGVESIILTVTPSPGNYGTRFGSATMLMTDNDSFASGTVGFTGTTATVAENVGTHNVPVFLNGTPPGSVSVSYYVSGGTAAGNGIDFTLAEGVLNFSPGETIKNIPVSIRNDILPEPAETIVIQLFYVIGANLGTSTFTLTVNNLSLPEAFSDPASGVSSSAMTFNGRVIPGGLATTYWFEYGGTTAYGQTTPVQNLTASNLTIIVGAPVTGLTLSSYHFRLVAQNSLGTTYGIDQFPGIISEPPLIQEHPQDLVVNIGESASFSVTASGGGLSYQWQKDTVDIPLATAPIYTIPVTLGTSGGAYRCVVTNTDGEDTSTAAILTVVTPPMITQHPSSLALDAGQGATFTVAATGLFLSYQWQKDTVDLPGQTGASLIFPLVSTLNDGSYRCVVSNSAGSDTSNPATLVVNGPPNIVQHPQNIAVILGGSATFTVVAKGPGVSYQWQKGTTDIGGETGPSYTIPTVAGTNAGNYRCRVRNVTTQLNEVFSNDATLTVVSPPVLVAPLAPSSVNLNENSTFTSSVTINGLFLSYQWRQDGLNVPGATTPTLTIQNLKDAHNGSYTCRVWNAADEVITPAVTLLVVTPPEIVDEPADALVDVGLPATLSVTATGPLLTYQWWRNGLPITGATSSSYTINQMSQAALGLYYCKVSNSAGTATTRFALAGILGMPVITRVPYPALAETGAYLRMEVQADGTDLTYAWKLNGKPAGSGPVLDIWPYATKNAGQYIVEVKNLVRTATTLPTTITTVSDMSPALDLTTLKWTTSGPVFWRPSIPAQAKDGKDAITVGNMPDGYFSMLGTRVTGPLVLKWWQKVSTQQDGDYLHVQMDRVDAMPALSGELEWQEKSLSVPAGVHQIDFIYAKNDATAGGQDRVWVDMVSTTPAFEPTGMAESRLVASGTTVNFNATYTGTPATFQWRKKGAAIKGATSAHFAINGIKTTDAGIYDCVLGGLVNGVSMTRITPPVEVGVVDSTGSRKVVPAGAKLTLSVTAVGNNPLYQWRRISTGPLPGETGKTLSLVLYQPGNSDDYICAVTNAGGTVDGGTHTVRVFNQGPDLTLAGPLDAAVLSGSYHFPVPYDQLPARTPTLFTAKGLPKGLVIDKATGVITGIPEESRVQPYPVTITASNSVDDDSVETTILVNGLGTKTGTFTGLLPRHPDMAQNLGGRLDLVITGNGSFSGTLCLGAGKHPFKARLQTSVLNLNQATSQFDVARGKDPSVRINLLITEAGLMTGTATLGSAVSALTGWKAPWTTTAPATAFTGTGAPAGCYNFALTMPPGPILADPKSPQGTGYGSFTINRDTGAVTISGRLADDTGYTSSGFLGAQGQLFIFTPLYTAPALGSVCGQMLVAVPTVADDNLCSGSISWSRPAMAKVKLDPDGFPQPVDLLVDGGRYVAPAGSTGLILGLSTTGASTANLTFLNGGIGNPPPAPDILVTLTAGNKVNYPAAAQNPRGTTLALVLNKGSFSGGFTLNDNDPLDLRPPPAITRKLPRKPAFQGLLVRGSAGWKGVGYFLLSELPDANGETLTTTPVHSGEVRLLPVIAP